jgi:cell division initiation protein
MRAKQILAEMEDRLKGLVENYKKLESSRDDLLTELKRIASDALERAERARKSSKEFDADQHLNMAKREAKKIAFPNHEFDRYVKSEPAPQEPVKIKPEPVSIKEVVVEQTFVSETVGSAKTLKSFFDEIG